MKPCATTFIRESEPSLRCIISNIRAATAADTVEDLFGLDHGWFDGGTIEFGGDVNLLKGAIVTADAVTAVSPTYAQELKYAYFAHGLENVMSMNARKLHGVLNGIDMQRYDPSRDKSARSGVFSADDLAGQEDG